MKNILKLYLGQFFGVKIRLQDFVRDIEIVDFFELEDDFRNFLEGELGIDKIELLLVIVEDVEYFVKNIFD